MLMRVAVAATIVMLPMSAIGQTMARVATIPPVKGMTASAATDTLRWTRLQIVQLPSVTESSRPGIVVDQRPRAGTPVNAVKAETLFVAAAPGAKPKGIRWGDILVSAVAEAMRKPPRARPTDSSTSPPVVVPTDVPTESGEDSTKERGTRIQDRTFVPDLVQSTPNQVSAALERRHLRPGKVGRGNSDNVQPGTVFKQDPPAGEEVATGSEVAVWYSIGPHPEDRELVVPSVRGLDLREAVDSLKRSGLRAGHVAFIARRDAERTVVDQEPIEGQRAHPNDPVDLTIATPSSQVLVPSLKSMTRDAARRRLEEVGLGEGRYTLVALANRDTGIVSQIPQAGEMVDSASLVDLVENRPPEVRRVRVPDLRGRSVAESDSILQRDSLMLGDVLRPGVKGLDRVIDQRPRSGEMAFIRSPVMIALGSTAAITDTLIRLPGVVNLTIDSARHILADSGFARLSISAGRDRLTSASTVERQIPLAGTFVAPSTVVSLFARAALPLLPVPDLVGQTPQVAQLSAELDGLAMRVASKVRGFRLHDEVVRQYPEAGQPRRADKSVDVIVEFPVIPPLAVAVLTFGVVGGIGGESVRRWRRRNRVERPTPGVTLKPVTGVPAPPVLHAEALGSLIKASFTLHFGVESDPSTLEVQGDSLVKPEK